MSGMKIPPKLLMAARFAAVRWELLTPAMRSAATAATLAACAGAFWLGSIGPGLALLGKAQADRAAILLPDVPSKEELRLASDKASFAKLKAASLADGGAPSASPDSLARVGQAAGSTFAGASVDAQAGWPQDAGGVWRHLVELRLAGTWAELAQAIDHAEPLVNGTATEFALDRAPDGRLALRARWIVSSPRRDWGASAREPAAQEAAPSSTSMAPPRKDHG